jgi:putative NIF3 family GTP cyclohydrolase 1 type 2
MSAFVTRREFVRATAGSLVFARTASARGMQAPLTANAVVDRIRAAMGVPWRAETVDTFKAGNPDTAVRGIATTVMATLSVLERAAAAGLNLIITHEPTFYTHTDATDDLQGDPIYQRKQEVIAQHDLVVWRFHDHWHLRRPEPMTQGLAQALGWEGRSTDGRVFTVPTMTLEAAARHVADRLNVQTLRVIGAPETPIETVVFVPGASSPANVRRGLADADLVIAGEQREWEAIPYAHDAAVSGRPKGLIVLGHAISEEPGMRICAEWLETVVPEVPVELVPAGEPFWRPVA